MRHSGTPQLGAVVRVLDPNYKGLDKSTSKQHMTKYIVNVLLLSSGGRNIFFVVVPTVTVIRDILFTC